MTEELREKMGESAIKAASSIDYTGAGTIEFMYENGSYYFLEMNIKYSRTSNNEIVTNTDLVKNK